MTDDDPDDNKSTTFTFKPETEEFLEQAYPDALRLNEAIRTAIADARKLHDADLSISDDDE